MVIVCRSCRELVVLESVAGAFEGDDVGVMNDPVDHRRGDGQVAEHVSPAVEGNVADLVNNQQAVPS